MLFPTCELKLELPLKFTSSEFTFNILEFISIVSPLTHGSIVPIFIVHVLKLITDDICEIKLDKAVEIRLLS